MSIQIIALTNDQIEAFRPEIIAIYRDAFGRPPYNKPEPEIAAFAQSLLQQLDRTGYRFVGAVDTHSDRLAGFAYGYDSAAGRWWCEHVRSALPAAVASVWLEDSYQFVELAVDPQHQGQGIGGRLHDELLRGLRHRRAVLSTLQAETSAHHLYRSRGWIMLLEDFFFPSVSRRYRIMGLELTRPTTARS